MLRRGLADRNNRSIGTAGEKIAEFFLRTKRYKIIGRNKKTPFGEIDLIALDGNTLVFVEVKARISISYGPPALSITASKKRSIIRNALYYIKRFGFFDSDSRIDVISINLNEQGKLEKFEHMKSAIWME